MRKIWLTLLLNKVKIYVVALRNALGLGVMLRACESNGSTFALPLD